MKIGILNAIHPDFSSVNWDGSPIDAYIRFFRGVNAPFDFTGYEVAQMDLPETPAECDAYVITGSISGVYDSDPWIAELTQFIRSCYQAGKKLVGICFGHQILAHALGGKAEKSVKGWGLGLKAISITAHRSWMTEKPDHCSLYFAHQDQVVLLPPGAKRLGGNEFCPNAFYVIGDQVLGVQGHPEFTHKIMAELLDQMGGNVDSTLLNTAVQSLNKTSPDNQLFAHWIVNFLLGDTAA